MYIARTATVADLDAVIALVARLQRDPAHQIGFHGDTEDEIAEELASLTPDWAGGAVVAVDRNGRVRGALSVEVDGERAALYGPFVDVPANHPAAGHVWQATADAMLTHVSQLPRLSGVRMLDLVGHRKNRLLADFAARHGAPIRMTTRGFTLTAAPLRNLLVRGPAQDDRTTLLPEEPAIRQAVVSLHDRCFPDAPTDGRQLVSRDRHTVVVLIAGGHGAVLGYAAGHTQADEYHVDVVGVEEDARSCGVGRTVVRRLLAELAAQGGLRDRATVTIQDGDDASERMFTKLGFELHAELVGYEADLTTPRAHRPAV
jgi:ribosomal protein S18 acetylase RimI-like enzyme